MTSEIGPVYFLLVDDLEENLLSLEGLLRRDGLVLLKARSGTEALELLLTHDVALAILDVQMPEMDGYDLAELMRVVVAEVANAAETVNEAEIARAKAQMKAGMLMALESSGARAEQLARQIIVHGRPVPMDEIVAKIDAVTVESTRAAGRALISRSRPAVAALGPSGLDRTAAIADRLAQKAA